MSVNVREAALNSLIRCEKDGRYSNIELDASIKKYNLTGVDRSFFTALVYGVIERKITLDYIITQYSRLPLDTLDIFILNIIRLGVYQILYMTRVPDSAACNESVEQAKQRSNSGAVSFVNAVLRETVRNKNILSYPMREDGLTRYLSVKHSLPEWLCDMWREMYGDVQTEKIAEAVNRRPFITLRVNTMKTTRDDLLIYLNKKGIESAAACTANGITLKKDIPIYELPISEGLCYVQDTSSQLCAEALEPAPGETVIDTCACPGGKSFACALLMMNKGNIYSLDLHKNKLSLIEEGATKLGITIINTAVQDGTKTNEIYFNKADRVLCDVPCSGLGVIARKPDLRYKTPEDLKNLPEVQFNILNTASAYVKPGGILVYSTCTLNINENEQVTERFLLEKDNFIYDGFGLRTLFPDKTNDSDGFFIARFKRIK
ncbi:MAG: 16S rRNA (cytosine(967)-C(5))-methyltransferase RsmB [Eubacteriales bacterium]